MPKMKYKWSSMTNKVAIFSDLHLGIKQDSVVWHNIALKWCDWFVSELKKREISDIVFLGDFFHTRNTISANTLHIASEVLNKMNDFNVHFILGNHDLYYANEPTVSPVNLFQGRNNIKVYAKPETVKFGNKSALMCGWGYNPEDYEADVLFTHAEINAFRFNTEVGPCENGFKASGLLKNFNIVYSGHFHLRQKKKWGDKEIAYVGNTFPMDHSDNHLTKKGFDIFNFDTFESEFIENKLSPRFYKIRLSELAEYEWPIEEMFTVIHQNNIKLIIDRNITYQDSNILKSLIDNYEPLDFNIEWENGKNFSQEISEISFEALNMKEAIKRYVECLDIPDKESIKDYMVQLYEKTQV